jgi:hypothetical protein
MAHPRKTNNRPLSLKKVIIFIEKLKDLKPSMMDVDLDAPSLRFSPFSSSHLLFYFTKKNVISSCPPRLKLLVSMFELIMNTWELIPPKNTYELIP